MSHRRNSGCRADQRSAIRQLSSAACSRRMALRVRRETGKELVVQVHCDEGLASHIGPEPCAVVRKGRGEASAGERIGQPLSRESYRLESRRCA
jgi:hypothetical protein